MAASRPEGRRKGRIEQRGSTLRVVGYAGDDPVTGRRVSERETIQGHRCRRVVPSRREGHRLRAKVIKQRNTPASVNLGYASDEWFGQADLEDSTRNSYAGYISRVIRPVLGGFAFQKLGARELETLYSELRRCRERCDGKPSIEHKATDDHSFWTELECTPHKCNPMAPALSACVSQNTQTGGQRSLPGPLDSHRGGIRTGHLLSGEPHA